MTNNELNAIIGRVKEQYDWDYDYIGIRFEDKDRKVNEIITEVSKDNADRNDEREFPSYGTAEYDEMADLNGVSAYNVKVMATTNNDDDITTFCNHCYVLGSFKAEYGPDADEIVMRNAVVLEIVF